MRTDDNCGWYLVGHVIATSSGRSVRKVKPANDVKDILSYVIMATNVEDIKVLEGGPRKNGRTSPLIGRWNTGSI